MTTSTTAPILPTAALLLPEAPLLRHIAALIADDGYASTFQSLGQYRVAVLATIMRALTAPEA